MTLTSEALQRRALQLAGVTIVWNVVEAGVAISSGVAAGSIALVGFGLDSVIEVFAASVVIWQLRGATEERERRALKLIAVTFFILAAYVVAQSLRDLVVRSKPHESAIGIGLAIASLIVMPLLGLAKRRTGAKLGSRTVVADAAETMLCSYLSGILLAGLILNATVGWWWADPLAALGIAALALREGREAWAGEVCCD